MHRTVAIFHPTFPICVLHWPMGPYNCSVSTPWAPIYCPWSCPVLCFIGQWDNTTVPYLPHGCSLMLLGRLEILNIVPKSSSPTPWGYANGPQNNRTWHFLYPMGRIEWSMGPLLCCLHFPMGILGLDMGQVACDPWAYWIVHWTYKVSLSALVHGHIGMVNGTCSMLPMGIMWRSMGM